MFWLLVAMSNRKQQLEFDVSYMKYTTYRDGGSGGGDGGEYEMKLTFEYNHNSQNIINTAKSKIMASARQYFTYYIFLPRWNTQLWYECLIMRMISDSDHTLENILTG